MWVAAIYTAGLRGPLIFYTQPKATTQREKSQKFLYPIEFSSQTRTIRKYPPVQRLRCGSGLKRARKRRAQPRGVWNKRAGVASGNMSNNVLIRMLYMGVLMGFCKAPQGALRNAHSACCLQPAYSAFLVTTMCVPSRSFFTRV